MPFARAVLVAMSVVVASCSSGTLPGMSTDGGVDLAGPAPDLARPAADLAAPDLAAPAPDLAQSVDLANLDLVGACGPSGGCPSGPRCGATCCNAGELCDPSTNTCRCGSMPACQQGDMCTTGGPVMPGQGRCGLICCGKSQPCPL